MGNPGLASQAHQPGHLTSLTYLTNLTRVGNPGLASQAHLPGHLTSLTDLSNLTRVGNPDPRRPFPQLYFIVCKV